MQSNESGEPMRATKNVLKILTASLVVILSISIVQVILGEQPYESKTPVTPTGTPETSFITDIPQKVLWENYFNVSVEAAPGTACDLLYVPPVGKAQEMTSTANKDGKCVWRWKIKESQGEGDGKLIITIDGRSETHFFEIRSGL